MAIHYLENDQLLISISTFGAELQSIRSKTTNFEYLWHADKTYWARRSPVLFPIVGKVWDGHMRYQGIQYPLSQHGFARDCEFTHIPTDQLRSLLPSSDAQSCGFVLHSNPETQKIYPFQFSLYIIYQLSDNQLTVNWIVRNNADTDLYFQIGAHPAFNYRNFDPEAPIQGYIQFDKHGEASLTTLECGGYAAANRATINIPSDGLPITPQTFDGDALVFERQFSVITLCDQHHCPYVEVAFQAPVVGLWSPAKTGYAPFLCIEPWYGRCDDSHFDGDYNQKPYINHVNPNQQFNTSYTIKFL